MTISMDIRTTAPTANTRLLDWVDAMATPEDEIRKLPHSTLIVHGRDDQVIPVDNAFRLLNLIDRSQVHIFGRCGHWTQIEHAKAFNQLLLNFLA